MSVPALPVRFHVSNMASEIVPVVEKPLHSLAEARQASDYVIFQNLDRQNRNQPDQRANAQVVWLAVGVQLIIIKAVLFLPEAGAAQRIHGVGDGDEMFEKLRGNVFIGRLLSRQLQSHGKHGYAVKGHPGGSVSLFQSRAVGQLLGTVEQADV